MDKTTALALQLAGAVEMYDALNGGAIAELHPALRRLLAQFRDETTGA